jgi:hypothetical protein
LDDVPLSDISDEALIKSVIKSGHKQDIAFIKAYLSPLTPENKTFLKNARAAKRQEKYRIKHSSKDTAQEKKTIPDLLLKYWLTLSLWQKRTARINILLDVLIDELSYDNEDLPDNSSARQTAINKAVFDLKLYR